MKHRIIDQVEFRVKAGNGGNGVISFLHEKYKPKGGPDGGDGGNGGSIYFITNPHMTTLMDYAGRDHFEANNGEKGRHLRQHGKDSEDVVLEVPVGTVVWEKRIDEAEEVDEPNEYREVPTVKQSRVVIHGEQDIVIDQPANPIASEWTKLVDMNESGMKVLIARGGTGGRGNDAFKSSINTAPKYAEPGTPGEKKYLRLEMKILADIGLVGLPNAGKSTLLSVLTAAHPEIANYPFTTITQNLGVMEIRQVDGSTGRRVDENENLSKIETDSTTRLIGHSSTRQLIVADIPGLIEDAHIGKGLGVDFLRHIERCRVLVYVISPTEEDLTNDQDQTDSNLPSTIHHPPLIESLIKQFNTVRHEVQSYNQTVDEKPRLVVINKIDILSDDQIDAIKQAFQKQGETVILISAAAHIGLDQLKTEIGNQIALA